MKNGELSDRIAPMLKTARESGDMDERVMALADALQEIAEFADNVDANVGECVTERELNDALDRLHVEIQR